MNYWNIDTPDYNEDFRTPQSNEDAQKKIPTPFSSVPKLESQFEISIHSGRITLKNNTPEYTTKIMPKREPNDITQFTSNSRRRLMSIFSRIDFSRYSHPLFLTTTFHNVFPADEKSLKQLLDKFLKRVKNKNNKFHYVWKLELQKRGAPHFHFLILPLYYQSEAEKNNMQTAFITSWHKYIADFGMYSFLYSAKFVDFKKVSKIKRYILKYLEKTDNAAYSYNFGRVWSRSKNLYLNEYFNLNLSFENFKLIKSILYFYCKETFKISPEMMTNFYSNSSISVCVDFSVIFKHFRENLFSCYPCYEIDLLEELFCKIEKPLFLSA